jgi:hypothetical protein
MLGKTVFILSLILAPATLVSAHHQPQSAEWAEWTQRIDDRLLPEELSEAETQTILKEQGSRSHVEATIKVSDARIGSAAKLAQEKQYKEAARDVDIYAALIRYANDYTRKLPSSQIKDRNHCLKKIEQAIFKQTRTFDSVAREMPFDYREAAERAINEVKKIRLRAINDLLGGGSIINSSNE